MLGDVEQVVAAAHGPGDTVHLVLRHAGGASSTAALSLTAPGAGQGHGAEFRGESGVATMPAGNDGAVTCLGRAIDALLESARTGRAHNCDVRFGLRVVEILAAAERLLEGLRRSSDHVRECRDTAVRVGAPGPLLAGEEGVEVGGRRCVGGRHVGEHAHAVPGTDGQAVRGE